MGFFDSIEFQNQRSNDFLSPNFLKILRNSDLQFIENDLR